MVDPVTLIVTALVTALTAAVGEIGRSAAHDAYEALKAAIIRIYGNAAAESIAQLEAQPESRARREQVAQVMYNFSPSYAAQLVPLAEHLMLLVEDGPIVYSVDKAKRTAGANVVYGILEDNTDYVVHVRDRYDAKDAELLSSRISQASNIPPQIRADISSLHGQIRAVIEHTAALIEEGSYLAAEQEAANVYGYAMRQRAWGLVQADKHMHISYEALRLTIETFGDLNSRIIRRIDRAGREGRSDRELQMLFGNAVMIYEMADFTIKYIENFALRGTDDIDDLHQYMIQRIEDARRADNEFEEATSASATDEPVKEGAFGDIRYRQDALVIVEEEWKKYIEETKRFGEQIGTVRAKLPTLKTIRENAWRQIDVLEIMAMARYLKLYSSTLAAAAEELTKFKLASLTPERVRRLLNIEEPGSED